MSEVTVVVPTRNRVALLGLTLRSILRQRHVDLRVVVLDEASSDPTPAMLAELAHADPRVRVVRNERPTGAAAARNAGLAVVSSPWVAFCDDDDLWAPTKLRRQLDAAGDRSWVATGAVLVNNDLAILDHQRLPPEGGDVLPLLLGANLIPGGGSGVLGHTDLVRDAGGFREDQRNAEDWDLWIRLAERAPLAVVDAPLVGYRIWPGSKSRVGGDMERAWDQITERYRHLAHERGVVPDRAGHRRYLAKQHLRDGRRQDAIRCFRVAADGRIAWLVPRVVAAAVAPRGLDRIGTWRAQRSLPPSWAAEAAAWLAELQRDGRQWEVGVG